jgi:hypothetical protein
MYNLDLQDELKLSEVISVLYGAELQVTDPEQQSFSIPPQVGTAVPALCGQPIQLSAHKVAPANAAHFRAE